MRLIDADALCLEGTASDIIEEIINAPTIDADLVVYGEWIDGRFHERYDNSYEEKCSICGIWSLEYDAPYCQSCGARMDAQTGI